MIPTIFAKAAVMVIFCTIMQKLFDTGCYGALQCVDRVWAGIPWVTLMWNIQMNLTKLEYHQIVNLFKLKKVKLILYRFITHSVIYYKSLF